MKTIYNLLIIALVSLAALATGQQAGAQNFVDYAEHSFWDDSYPIYDAVNYQGNLYALQSYENKYARLVKFNVDPSNGTMQGTDYWTVNETSSDYKNKTNIKLIVYKDVVYIFTIQMVQFGNVNWDIRSFRMKPDNSVEMKQHGSPTCMPDKYNHEMYPGFAVTVYKGEVCLFYINRENRQVYMIHSNNPEDPKSWKKNETFSQVIYYERPIEEDSWDVCTWYGKENGVMKEKLIAGLIAGRNMWTYTFEDELNNSTLNKWKAVSYINGAPEFGTINLKLLQGNIVGVGSDRAGDNRSNPLQFIYSIKQSFVSDKIHQRQILTQEYFPSTNSFGPANGYAMATNLPYGYFGAALMSFPFGAETKGKDKDLGATVTQQHQQYICILRGAIDNHFKGDSHYALIKSNRTQVTRCDVTGDVIINDPALRSLCTLTGVIEGPPPSVIDNPTMYEKTLPGNSDYISFLSFEQEQQECYEEQNSTGFNINAGLGPDLDAFTLQVTGGYEMQQSYGKTSTYKKSKSTTYLNHDTLTAKRGSYLYSVPNLSRFTHTYFSTDGKRQLDDRQVLVTYRQTGMIEKSVPYLLNDEAMDQSLRVSNPLHLEDWEERSTLFHGVPYNNAIFRTIYSPLKKGGDKLESSITNSNTQSSTIKLGGEVKTVAFKMEGNYIMGYSSSTSSTMSKGVSIELPPLSSQFEKYSERGKPVGSYTLTGYFLNDPTDEATARYYADLKRRGIMLEGEKPFILAWGITQIGYGYKLQGETATASETLIGDDVYVVGDRGALRVTCPAGRNVQIYNLSGRKEADCQATGSEMSVPLPAGIYFIRITDGVKQPNVCKVIVR